MRLNQKQRDTIRQTIRHALPDAVVLLYGSRLDDERRGGDIDLVIKTDHAITLKQKAGLKLKLETALQLPVDLLFVVSSKTPTPFQRLAMDGAQVV